jgi:hypothetical protein
MLIGIFLFMLLYSIYIVILGLLWDMFQKKGISTSVNKFFLQIFDNNGNKDVNERGFV